MIKPFNPLTATASDHLQQLSQGSLTSVQLVDVYLAQIYARNDYLKAVIDIVPTERLLSQAEKLDVERKAGTLRGSLHGIPILIKDNIATHPSLSLRTACGSFLLAESRPAKNADIVDKLVDSGAIILGKANLSEMSYWKGDGLPCGWSALGGQTQSPYVRGGFDKNEDSPGGHSSTGGSSSGSAAGVAAGFAPVSIGSETNGSLIMPGTRAALYTIKPTIGLVSTQGIVPICPMTDSAGPMTKCARDLAIMMDVLVDPSTTKVPIGGYTSCLNMLMADLRVCALDPTKWMLDEQICKPDKGASEQMLRDNLAAYKQIESHAKAFHWNVPLVSPSDLKAREEESLYDLYDNDFQDAIEEYLGQLESSPVRTLEELIAGNEKMAEKELPPGYTSQSRLKRGLTHKMTPSQRSTTVAHLRHTSRTLGIDKILSTYDADVIIGPADSDMTSLAAAAGYPICTLPVGYLNLNGRAFGLSVLAGQHGEGTLIGLMAAWEAIAPTARKPPPSMG